MPKILGLAHLSHIVLLFMTRYFIFAATAWLIFRFFRTYTHTRPVSKVRQKTKDPYTVLELAPGASVELIKKTYRTKIAENHPDKVQHLSKEIQETARIRTYDIQWAYDELLARRR